MKSKLDAVRAKDEGFMVIVIEILGNTRSTGVFPDSMIHVLGVVFPLGGIIL